MLWHSILISVEDSIDDLQGDVFVRRPPKFHFAIDVVQTSSSVASLN